MTGVQTCALPICCQLNRRRQRRNWRVRAVERGQRSEPAWLRAHPGLRDFEPEKLARTQIPRNVWDTEAAVTGDGVNYNSERNLAKRKLAPQVGLEPTTLRLTGGVPGHELGSRRKNGQVFGLFAEYAPISELTILWRSLFNRRR